MGTGVGYSVFDILKEVEAVTNKPIPFRLGDRRDGDPPRLIADNSKVTKKLGWEPKIKNLNEIIKSAYNFIKEDK